MTAVATQSTWHVKQLLNNGGRPAWFVVSQPGTGGHGDFLRHKSGSIRSFRSQESAGAACRIAKLGGRA